MWCLTSDSDERFLYVVPQRSEIILGRSPDTQICNFAILDDPSISRKHATFTISENCLFVQDLGSRYGTFINESTEKLEINCNVRLNDNDVIKFGKMNCVWRVHEINLTTCTSTLKGENLQNVRSILCKIGGTMKSDWNDSCAYLTMPAITLTIKVVLALVQGSHIVTTEFWSKCLEAVNTNTKIPDPGYYMPQVVESTLNKEIVCFTPNEQRKTLFAGKKFVFFSKRQHEMYKVVLIKSSAEPVLLSESKMVKSALCEQNVIVIQYNISNTSQETQAQRNQINDIVNYMKSKGKRLIADAEIGLAILYCSTEKYCNPDFNFPNEVVKQTSGQNKTSNVLVQESQETTTEHKREKIMINESLVSLNDPHPSGVAKRKLSEEIDDIQTNASKKHATGVINTSNESVNKRKFAEVDATTLNPSKKIATEANASENDDFFNFLDPVISNNDQNKTTEKKLNLSKPMKRKADFDSNEDDLFNFIELNDKSKSSAEITPKRGMFEVDREEQEDLDHIISHQKRDVNITPQDISAMRGTKLEELMKNKQNWDTDALKQNVKKEFNDLDEKMRELDLGTTIVTVRKNLIVKKEPIEIEETIPHVKNYKKFKKVWPIKMQVTIIPKTSMSVVLPGSNEEMGSLCGDANADENK